MNEPENLETRHSDHARRLFSASLPFRRRSSDSLKSSDSLRLSFQAFSQQFHLHLRPNDELLHPDGATVRYYAINETTGESYVSNVETLMPGDVRAYHGVVLHPSHSDSRLSEDMAGVKRNVYTDRDWGVVGRASVVVHDDGSVSGTPSFEGSFDWLGNTHYIQTARNYMSKRQVADPVLERRAEEDHGYIIIHRDSDIMSKRDAVSVGLEEDDESAKTGCSSDALNFNNASHLIMSGSNDDDFSLSALSFFNTPTPPRLARRDLFAGVAGLFGRSVSDDLIGRPEVAENGYVYERSLDDLLVPHSRRQSTGNDVGNGGGSDSFEDSIGSTQGCPNAARVVYVGVASDCAYTGRIGDEASTRTEILNNMNTVSNLYRSTFNISLGVVELDVRSRTCPSSPPSDARWNVDCGGDSIDERLSYFSAWRAQQPANGIGLWHLMTACATSGSSAGSEIGVAWLGTVCMTDSSSSGGQTVSGTGVSSYTSQQWQVMAHEMGHNFGAIHDCAQGCTLSGNFAVQNGGASCCPATRSSCDAGEQYIMNPRSQSNIDTFSQCSIGNICSLIGQGLDTSCIQTPGQRATLSTEQCGNGILEPGEECDAGPNGSACCTNECRLAPNARCDPSNSACCTQSCGFAPASQVCRPSVDDRCDTAETCTGDSAECPEDQKKNDGDSCGSGGLSCANGFCTSRDQQCRSASTNSMSFSRACSASVTNSCQLTCQDPRSARSCLILQQTFIDGTSCGNGGRCRGGECESGSWQDTFRGWYNNNLRIAIPVTIVVAIVVLVILWALARCCFGSLCGGRRRQQGRFGAAGRAGRRNKLSPSSSANATPPSGGDMRYNTAGAGAFPPPPQRTDRRSSRQPGGQNWVDPSAWNGPSPAGQYGGAQPAYPPPAAPPPNGGYYPNYNNDGGR